MTNPTTDTNQATNPTNQAKPNNTREPRITAEVTGGTLRSELLRAIVRQTTGHTSYTSTLERALHSAKRAVVLAQGITEDEIAELRIAVWGCNGLPVWAASVSSHNHLVCTDGQEDLDGGGGLGILRAIFRASEARRFELGL